MKMFWGEVEAHTTKFEAANIFGARQEQDNIFWEL